MNCDEVHVHSCLSYFELLLSITWCVTRCFQSVSLSFIVALTIFNVPMLSEILKLNFIHYFISTVHHSLLLHLWSTYHIIEWLCVVYLLYLPAQRRLCTLYGFKHISHLYFVKTVLCRKWNFLAYRCHIMQTFWIVKTHTLHDGADINISRFYCHIL